MPAVVHHYECVIVSRTQNESAAPDYEELGRILPVAGKGGTGRGLGYSMQKKGTNSITIATDPRKLPSGAGVRLRNLKDNPMELWLYRNGVLIIRGPIISWQMEGRSLILNAQGMLYYTKYMMIHTTKEFDDVDQAVIVGELIDDHQALDWGNFGIDTSSLTATTKLVDRKWDIFDLAQVFEEIMEMGRTEDGYDLNMDYETGEIFIHSYLSNPLGVGADKSDTVFLDFRGIATPNMSYSLAADSFGSAIIATSGEFKTTPFQDHEPTREKFGLAFVGHRILNALKSNAAVDEAAIELVLAAKAPVFTPNREYVTHLGLEAISDVDPGDLVTYVFDTGFGEVNYKVQIANINVSVGAGNTELINFEFVRDEI